MPAQPAGQTRHYRAGYARLSWLADDKDLAGFRKAHGLFAGQPLGTILERVDLPEHRDRVGADVLAQVAGKGYILLGFRCTHARKPVAGMSWLVTLEFGEPGLPRPLRDWLLAADVHEES